jgi:hypothetical protein
VSNLEWEIQPEAKKKIMRVVCSMLVRGLSKGLHVKLTKNLFAEFLIAEKYRLNFAEILFAEIFIYRNFYLPNCGKCNLGGHKLFYNTGPDSPLLGP